MDLIFVSIVFSSRMIVYVSSENETQINVFILHFQQTFYPIQTEDVHTGFNLTYIGGGMTK